MTPQAIQLTPTLIAIMADVNSDFYITSDNWLEYGNKEGVLRHYQLYGNWEILGWSDELSRDQYASLVMWRNHDTIRDGLFVQFTMYRDYISNVYQIMEAKDSFRSLIRSKGIEDRCLILKKKIVYIDKFNINVKVQINNRNR